MSTAVMGDGEAPKDVRRSVQQLRDSLVGLRQDLDSLFKVRRRIVSNRHELLEHYLQVGCEKFPRDIQAYGDEYSAGALSSSAPAPSAMANGMPKGSSSLSQGVLGRGSMASVAQHVGGESRSGAPSSLGSVEPTADQVVAPSPDECKALVLDFLQTAAASESMGEVAQLVRPDTISEVSVGDVVDGSCLLSVRYKDQLRPASDGMSCQEFMLERSRDNHTWVVQPPSSMKDGSRSMGLGIAGTPPPSPPTPSRSARSSRLTSRMSETLQLTQLVEEETEEISPRKIPGHERAKQWENPGDAAEALRSSIGFGIGVLEPSSTPRQVFRGFAKIAGSDWEDFARMAGEGLIEREQFAGLALRYGGINPEEKDVNLLASILFDKLAISVGEERGVPYDIFCTELHGGGPDAAVRVHARKKALLKKVQAAVQKRLGQTCGLSDYKKYILDRAGSEPLKEQAFTELVKELVADPACKEQTEPVALKALWCDLARDSTIGKREATPEQVVAKLLEGLKMPAEASARPVLEEDLVEAVYGASSPRDSGREVADHDADPAALLDVVRLGISLDRRPTNELLKAAVKSPDDSEDGKAFVPKLLSKKEFCTFIAKFAGGQPLVEAGEDRAFQATTTDAGAQLLFHEMAITGPDGTEAVPVDILLAEVCPDKAPDSRSRVAKAVRLLLQELSTAANVKGMPDLEPQHKLTETSFQEVVRDALPNPEEPLTDPFAVKALWLFLTHHSGGRKAAASSPSSATRHLSFEELRKALSGDLKDRSSIPLDYSDCESSALELTQDETITPFLSPQSRQQQSSLQAAPSATVAEAAAESSSSVAADQSSVAAPPVRQKKAVRVSDSETAQLAKTVVQSVFAKISSILPVAPVETPLTSALVNKEDGDREARSCEEDGAGSAEVATPSPEVVEDILRHVKEGAVSKASFPSRQSGSSQVEPVASSPPAATSDSVNEPSQEQQPDKHDDSDEDLAAVRRVPSRKTFAEIEESASIVYDLLEQLEAEEEEQKAKRRSSRSGGASPLQASESGRRKSYRMPTMTKQVSMAVSEADSESWQDPGAIDDQLVILARSMQKVRSCMEVSQSERQQAAGSQQSEEEEEAEKSAEEKHEDEEVEEKEAKRSSISEARLQQPKVEETEKLGMEEKEERQKGQEQEQPPMDEGVHTTRQATEGPSKRAALIEKIEKDPDVARYWAEVAQLMSAGERALIGGKVMKQLDLLVQAIELDPSCASAFSDLGAVMSADNKCKEVQLLDTTWTEKDLYIRAIELDQSCANPYLNLSDIMGDSEVLTIKGEDLSKSELKRRGEALERGEFVQPQPVASTTLQAGTAGSDLGTATPEAAASSHEKPRQSEVRRMGREEIQRRLEELKNAGKKGGKQRAEEARPTTEDSEKSHVPMKFLHAQKHVKEVEKQHGEMSDEFCNALLELAECAGKMKAHKEERTTLERVLKLQDVLYAGRSEADTEVASKKRATLVALVDVYRVLDDEHAEIDALHRLEDMEQPTTGDHHHHLHLGQELHQLPPVAEAQHHLATSSLPSVVVPFMQHSTIFKETGIGGQPAMMTPPRHDPFQGNRGGIEHAELMQEASSLLGASSLLSEVTGEEDDSPFKFSAAARGVHKGGASELLGEGRPSATLHEKHLDSDNDVDID